MKISTISLNNLVMVDRKCAKVFTVRTGMK